MQSSLQQMELQTLSFRRYPIFTISPPRPSWQRPRASQADVFSDAMLELGRSPHQSASWEHTCQEQPTVKLSTRIWSSQPSCVHIHNQVEVSPIWISKTSCSGWQSHEILNVGTSRPHNKYTVSIKSSCYVFIAQMQDNQERRNLLPHLMDTIIVMW